LTPEFKAVMSEIFNETKQEATAQDTDALTIRAFVLATVDGRRKDLASLFLHSNGWVLSTCSGLNGPSRHLGAASRNWTRDGPRGQPRVVNRWFQASHIGLFDIFDGTRRLPWAMQTKRGQNIGAEPAS
jgi:hypothetical protein